MSFDERFQLKTFWLWWRPLTVKRPVLCHKLIRYSIICSTRNSFGETLLKVSWHLVLRSYALRTLHDEFTFLLHIGHLKSRFQVPICQSTRVLPRVNRSDQKLPELRSISSPNCGSDSGQVIFVCLFWIIWRLEPRSHFDLTQSSQIKCNPFPAKNLFLQ